MSAPRTGSSASIRWRRSPAATVETILQGLPGRKPKLSDGTVLARNAHPLKHFIFDRTGRLFVNIGAPSDKCATGTNETKPCAAGEGAAPLAAVWMFTPPAGGIFPRAAARRQEPAARGVRARLAQLDGARRASALSRRGLRAAAGRERARPARCRQTERGDQRARRGKHYGWPYCYDLATVSPEYAAFLKAGPYRNLCSDAARYRRPHSLLPPHAAPLGMLYYEGDEVSRARRQARRRPARLSADRQPRRLSTTPMRAASRASSRRRCITMSAARRAARVPHRERSPGRGRAPIELIGDWHKVNGVRPQGAPVGMTVAADGAIWLAEDKNQTIIRIEPSRSSAPRARCRAACARRSRSTRSSAWCSATPRAANASRRCAPI